jgi:hypothetical protein
MINALRAMTALTVTLLAIALAAEADVAATADELIGRGEAQLAEREIDRAVATPAYWWCRDAANRAGRRLLRLPPERSAVRGRRR